MRDEIARIFSTSPRASRLLPDIQPSTAGAVCLARYVQDPLQEMANMWLTADALGFFGHEVLYLDLHPLLVNNNKMFEWCLIILGISTRSQGTFIA